MPKNLHYIFDSGAPQSPAKPLQDLIVLKKNAAHCRRWVKAIERADRVFAMIPAMRFLTLALRFEVDGKPCTIIASSLISICSTMHVDRRAVGAVVVSVGFAF